MKAKAMYKKNWEEAAPAPAARRSMPLPQSAINSRSLQASGFGEEIQMQMNDMIELEESGGSRRRERQESFSFPTGGLAQSSQKAKIYTKSTLYDYERHGIWGSRIVRTGERLMVLHDDGNIVFIDGPATPKLSYCTSCLVREFRADSKSYLRILCLNGMKEHIGGPTSMFFDPLKHVSIYVVPMISLNNDEAIVVYRGQSSKELSRDIVLGPKMYVPTPQEWSHEFRWGGEGGDKFAKLSFVPESLLLECDRVRTVDDGLLTLNFMVVFQLYDVEKMLAETEDPIDTFTTAMSSDVIAITSKLSLDGIKDVTPKLSEPETYVNLLASAAANGFRILQVIFRGYTPNQALEALQEKNVAKRTGLQLEKERVYQEQELLAYTQHAQFERAQERRDMELGEKRHTLQLQLAKQVEVNEKEKALFDEQMASLRNSYESALEKKKQENAEILAYYKKLHGMGVDLTKYTMAANKAR